MQKLIHTSQGEIKQEDPYAVGTRVLFRPAHDVNEHKATIVEKPMGYRVLGKNSIYLKFDDENYWGRAPLSAIKENCRVIND